MNRIAISLIALASLFGSAIAHAQTQQATDTQKLVETFIQLGVIAPEKAEAARTAVGIRASTASSSIEILYPLRGNVLDNGSGKGVIAEIRWQQKGGSLPVALSLLNPSGQELRKLATGTPGTGSFKWQYDATIPEGSYELLVSTEGGPEIVWAKSGIFTLRSLSPSTCRDSDAGIQPNVAGTADDRVNGIGTSIADRSVSANGGSCSGASCTGVLEAYCENGKALSRVYQCSTGYSVNGTCAQKASQASTASQRPAQQGSVPTYVLPASYQYSPTYVPSYSNTALTDLTTNSNITPSAPTSVAPTSATPTNTATPPSGGGGGGGLDSSRYFNQYQDYSNFVFPSYPSYPTYPTFPTTPGWPQSPGNNEIWIMLPGAVGLSGLDRLIDVLMNKL